MKLLISVPFLFAACAQGAPILKPLTPMTEGGPTPVDQVVTTGAEIAAQVATGQYWAAGITAAGLVASLLGWKGYKRVKASGPGTLGILAPPPEPGPKP